MRVVAVRLCVAHEGQRGYRVHYALKPAKGNSLCNERAHKYLLSIIPSRSVKSVCNGRHTKYASYSLARPAANVATNRGRTTNVVIVMVTATAGGCSTAQVTLRRGFCSVPHPRGPACNFSESGHRSHVPVLFRGYSSAATNLTRAPRSADRTWTTQHGTTQQSKARCCMHGVGLCLHICDDWMMMSEQRLPFRLAITRLAVQVRRDALSKLVARAWVAWVRTVTHTTPWRPRRDNGSSRRLAFVRDTVAFTAIQCKTIWCPSVWGVNRAAYWQRKGARAAWRQHVAASSEPLGVVGGPSKAEPRYRVQEPAERRP